MAGTVARFLQENGGFNTDTLLFYTQIRINLVVTTKFFYPLSKEVQVKQGSVMTDGILPTEVLEKTLNAAMAAGADYADIYVQKEKAQGLNSITEKSFVLRWPDSRCRHSSDQRQLYRFCPLRRFKPGSATLLCYHSGSSG